MNDGDNDYDPSTLAFIKRQDRLRDAAEAIAVLGPTPKLLAELAECRADQLRHYRHDFIVDKARWSDQEEASKDPSEAKHRTVY